MNVISCAVFEMHILGSRYKIMKVVGSQKLFKLMSRLKGLCKGKQNLI